MRTGVPKGPRFCGCWGDVSRFWLKDVDYAGIMGEGPAGSREFFGLDRVGGGGIAQFRY